MIRVLLPRLERGLFTTYARRADSVLFAQEKRLPISPQQNSTCLFNSRCQAGRRKRAAQQHARLRQL